MGDLAAKKITLGSTTGENVSIPNLTIKCGHDDYGEFSNRANGIVGLGGGKISLITKIRSTIRGKFSYCLVPFQSQTLKRSKLNFGDNAVVSGAGVTSTPIVSKKPYPFYFLTLKGFTVGKLKLNYFDSPPAVSSDDFGEGKISSPTLESR
ncbi:aspartic proteinase CDR1-like [Primulina huaijiensis]|uniref:aspartic proteinase CDR1-like n=1 Tax=Primulina huaijiensis TaxID=1492673 RepID=UPI003CC754BA